MHVLNTLRNRVGAMANVFLPPEQEVFKGNDDPAVNVVLVGLRWDYGSRLNGDGFEYRRFIPGLINLSNTVYFVPIEAKRAIVPQIRTLARNVLDSRKTVILSVFKHLKEIPNNYFTLSEEGYCLVNWYTDDDMLFDPFSKHIAKRFDLNITTFEPILPRYKSINARAIASQWAGIDGYGFPECREYAACFVGRMYGRRSSLIKRLRKEFGDKVFIHDTQVKPISDEAMLSAYQNSWLAIDEPTAFDGRTKQIKARVFENASLGCLVLTKPNRRIARYYEPNKEIAFWETIPELIRIIRDCIDDPCIYTRMARLAHQRTQREHLYEHRFRNVLQYCWRPNK